MKSTIILPNFTSLTFLIVMIILIGISSWLTNIYKITQLDFESPYKAEVFRAVGIPLTPLGVVIGFMNIGEENNQKE